MNVFLSLGWEAWYTLVVLSAVIYGLAKDVAKPDLILLGGLGLLLISGVLAPIEGFSGFANPAVITIGALFVVAAGVQRTEALKVLDRILFSPSNRMPIILLRLMMPSAALSAFMNNTPLVAMLIPRVQQWGEARGLPASRLLIPLSYATILGGMTTLLGTSTNIIVSGQLRMEGFEELGMFELTWVGLPAALFTIGYFALVGHRMLPQRKRGGASFEEGLKDCLFELRVAGRSPYTGRTVEEAGLRALGDAFLVHIRRRGHLIPATPNEVLESGDELTFTGEAAALERLRALPGLTTTQPPIQDDEERTLPLFEAVVADSSQLVGQTLRDAEFREHYRGVVLAIQRKDEQLKGRLGRIPIQAGDLLLIESGNGFDREWNQNRREFYLVAPRKREQRKPLPKKAPIALSLLVGMIVAATLTPIPLSVAAFSAALGMVLFRCVRGTEARASVDGAILVAIASTFGIAHAVQETGLAALAAGLISAVATGSHPAVALLLLYVTTAVFTEVLTNNAAAILMLPVALSTAANLGFEPHTVAIVVAIAASASFMTPIGYQTNLMVMAAGGYRFRDYTRAGLPVSLIVMVVTVAVVYAFGN